MTRTRQQHEKGNDSDTGIDMEKDSATHSEHVVNGYITAEESAFLASFSDDQKKTVLRKVDIRLVPMLLILYLISFIDRANIGTHLSTCCSTLTLTGNRQEMLRSKVFSRI